MALFQKVRGETRDKEIRKPWRKEPARQCDAGKKGRAANENTDGAGRAKGSAKPGTPNACFPLLGSQAVGRSAVLPDPHCAWEASGSTKKAVLRTSMVGHRNGLSGSWRWKGDESVRMNIATKLLKILWGIWNCIRVDWIWSPLYLTVREKGDISELQCEAG